MRPERGYLFLKDGSAYRGEEQRLDALGNTFSGSAGPRWTWPRLVKEGRMYFGGKYTGENSMLLNYGPSWEDYWEVEEEYFTSDDLDRCPICGRKLREEHCEWCGEDE